MILWLASFAWAGETLVVPVDGAGNLWALQEASATLARGGETVPLRWDGSGFEHADVTAGAWSLSIVAPGFFPVHQEVVIPDEPLRLVVRLTEDFDTQEQMVVTGESDAGTLRRSAQAVTVVETEAAQKQAADLGEVMARTQGIGVRRAGGLGSETRFSLDGLTDDQIRFFLDGLPLDLSGYPFGISNVPVDLVERVEVYRGVVPIRFGADALGGAVNLVSEREGSAASLGYQVGSFDTHRLDGHLRLDDPKHRVFGDAVSFFDYSKNDYEVEVEVPDDKGRLSTATVPRFHDAYRAGGGALTLGLRDRPWAEELSIRGFGSGFYDEIQHNVVMTVPYGEPTYRVATGGGTARYGLATGAFDLDVTTSLTHANRAYTDLGECVYDWFGKCVRDRATPGEVASPGSDQIAWDDTLFARASLGWAASPHHRFSLSTAPTAFSRSGEDRLTEPGETDPLTAQRDNLTVVSGAEHTLTAWSERIENVAFLKHYLQEVRSEEPVAQGGFRRADRSTQRGGVGDGVRLALADWIWLKASYEWATRLPSPEEIFGDAALVLDNLDLVPETSHNGNVSASIDAKDTSVGDLAIDAGAFLREADNLIVLLGSDRTFTYFNVYSARSFGFEAAAGWTSPGEHVAVDLNGTWIDLRNTSDQGTFEDFEGDRIPNRPWLMANAGLAIGAPDVFTRGDRLEVNGWSRWVGEFYRGWESVGLEAYKQSVPSQLSHTAAVVYTLDGDRNAASIALEVDNLTNAKLYDYFGVQKPGRGIYLKLTATRKAKALTR